MQRALSRGLSYFPENHSTCKWLSTCSTATSGPCVGCSGCYRQPEQMLHPCPGLFLCPAFTPSQCPAHACSCWATHQHSLQLPLQWGSTEMAQPQVSTVPELAGGSRTRDVGQDSEQWLRENTAQYFIPSSPCHSYVVILLPTPRIFIYLFLMSSADGTKPSTASKQAASCLKFRTSSGVQWGRTDLICRTTIRNKINNKAYFTLFLQAPEACSDPLLGFKYRIHKVNSSHTTLAISAGKEH